MRLTGRTLFLLSQDVQRLRQAKEKEVQQRLQKQKQDYRVERQRVQHKRETKNENAAVATPPPLPEPTAPPIIHVVADSTADRRGNVQHTDANADDKDDRALIALAKDRALAAAGIIGTPPQPCAAANLAAEKPTENLPPRAAVRGGGVQSEIDR